MGLHTPFPRTENISCEQARPFSRCFTERSRALRLTVHDHAEARQPRMTGVGLVVPPPLAPPRRWERILAGLLLESACGRSDACCLARRSIASCPKQASPLFRGKVPKTPTETPCGRKHSRPAVRESRGRCAPKAAPDVGAACTQGVKVFRSSLAAETAALRQKNVAFAEERALGRFRTQRFRDRRQLIEASERVALVGGLAREFAFGGERRWLFRLRLRRLFEGFHAMRFHTRIGRCQAFWPKPGHDRDFVFR